MVKRKHIFESIVIVETVIIIIVAIFMFAGYPISLMLNGFAPQNSEILYAGIDIQSIARFHVSVKDLFRAATPTTQCDSPNH